MGLFIPIDAQTQRSNLSIVGQSGQGDALGEESYAASAGLSQAGLFRVGKMVIVGGVFQDFLNYPLPKVLRGCPDTAQAGRRRVFAEKEHGQVLGTPVGLLFDLRLCSPLKSGLQ